MTDSKIQAHTVAQFAADAPPYRVEVHSGRHRLVADEPESSGGQNAGPTPFVLWLSGLGACTAITLRMYAERKGWDLGGVTVELNYVGDDDDQHHIERTIRLGKPVDDEQRDRLIEIAGKTPVTKAVMAGTRIETTVV